MDAPAYAGPGWNPGPPDQWLIADPPSSLSGRSPTQDAGLTGKDDHGLVGFGAVQASVQGGNQRRRKGVDLAVVQGQRGNAVVGW